MKKQMIAIGFMICLLVCTSCNTSAPRDYFDHAVLNANLVYGFADDVLLQQLTSPGVILDPNTNKTTKQKSVEVMQAKIKELDHTLEKSGT